MGRHVVWQFAVALGLLAPVSWAASGADDLYHVLPRNTLALVMVNDLAQADAKAVAFCQSMPLPLPSLLAILKIQAGITTGLNEHGAAALVAVGGEDADDEPASLLYLPVADYQAFIRQLKPKELEAGISRVTLWNSSFLVRQVGSYAVFAELDQNDLLSGAVASPDPPQELLRAGRALAESDVSAAATGHGMQLACAAWQQQVDAVHDLQGNPHHLSLGPAVGMAEMYLGICKAVQRETDSLIAGLTFEKSGTLHLSIRGRVKPDSALAGKLSVSQPAKEDLLAGLPGGPFLLAGGGNLSADICRSAAELVNWQIEHEDFRGSSGENWQKIVDLSKELLKQIRGVAAIVGAAGTEAPVCRDILGVLRTDDSKQYLLLYQRYLKALQAIDDNPPQNLQKPQDVESSEFHGRPAVTFTLKSSLRVDAAPFVPVPLMETLVGKGGRLPVCVVAADAKHVLFCYQCKEPTILQALESLKASRTGLSADSQVARTAALLPAGALWVGYFSPPGMITLANRFLTQMPFAPGAALPDFPATPAVGLALTTAPGEIQLHVVAPLEVSRGIFAYYLKLMAPPAGAKRR